MAFEDDLGWEYFGADPMMSPRMQEHMAWHNDPPNKPENKFGNYGERFLLFHEQYIEKFDDFRASKGLLPVSGWDPSTQIPPALTHEHVLVSRRQTDDPFALNPHCKTPAWATIAGGTEPAPGYGYTRLAEFQSLDELGRAIDSGWHGLVHNTIDGDMSTFHSPIDPVFWRWHRWIDNVRADWVLATKLRVPMEIASVVKILFGIVNDAPGVWIGPDGRPHPWPGPDPFRIALSPALRDVLLGLLTQKIGGLVDHAESRDSLQKLGARLITLQMDRLK
jgi:tyrosinase-like protein